MRKPMFCICENKDADQLRGNREADQRLCFRYIDNMSLVVRKPVFRVSDLVRHKLGCAVIEDGWRLEISDLARRRIVLSV